MQGSNEFLGCKELKMDCYQVLVIDINNYGIPNGKHQGCKWGESDYQQHLKLKRDSTWTTREFWGLPTRRTRLKMEITWKIIGLY